MFIRETIKTDRKTGKKYTSYQLVESIRTAHGPRQKILITIPYDISLDPLEKKDLANRIEEIVMGTPSFLQYSEKIESLAQDYASQVIHRLSGLDNNPKPQDKEELPPEFVSIDINSIEKSEPRTVGSEHLLLQMAHQLKLSKKLQEIGLSKTDIAIALGSIIARAVSPDSERSTYNWLCNHSGLGELIDFNFNNTSLNKLYQISDTLLNHKDSLESHLESVEESFHGYKSTIALYDLTNTYMEGQAKSNPKATHGVSKEKRKDCPLVTLGVVMNEHGFLHRTSILPGNASEPKTLEEMIESLTVHQSLFKPTVILDAGIATKDNLAWLRKKGYGYIVSARQEAPSLEIEGELEPAGDLHDLVKVALIKNDENSEEKWLYCESEAKTAVAASMKQSFRSRFELDLKKLSEGLTKPRGRKKFSKVLERLGRLKEKHKRISSCYEVIVIPSEDGTTAASIEWKVIDEKMDDKLKGSYFLRTNLLDKNAKELWQLYNTLRGVEDAFRFMKSSLGLRPVYHQKEKRVDGHLWITVLAYHLIQNCLYQLQKNGLNHHWETIRKIMMSRVRVTMQAKTKEDKTLCHRSTTRAEVDQKKIYNALNMSPQILKARKTIL
jgi:transposase